MHWFHWLHGHKEAVHHRTWSALPAQRAGPGAHRSICQGRLHTARDQACHWLETAMPAPRRRDVPDRRDIPFPLATGALPPAPLQPLVRFYLPMPWSSPCVSSPVGGVSYITFRCDQVPRINRPCMRYSPLVSHAAAMSSCVTASCSSTNWASRSSGIYVAPLVNIFCNAPSRRCCFEPL